MSGWSPKIDEVYWQNNTYTLLQNVAYRPICANETHLLVYEYSMKRIIPLNITDRLNATVEGTVLSGSPTIYDPIASMDDPTNMIFYDNTGDASTVNHITYIVNPTNCGVSVTTESVANVGTNRIFQNNYYTTRAGYTYGVLNTSTIAGYTMQQVPKFYDQSGTNVYNRWEHIQFRATRDYRYVVRGELWSYTTPTSQGSSIRPPQLIRSGATDNQYIFDPTDNVSKLVTAPMKTSTLCYSDGNHIYGIIEEAVDEVSTMFLRKFDLQGNVVLEKKLVNSSDVLADGVIAGADDKYLYLIELPLNANYPDAYIRRIRTDNFTEEGNAKLPSSFKIQEILPTSTAFDLYRRVKYHYLSSTHYEMLPCYLTKNGYLVLVIEAQSLSGTYHWDALRIKV